MERLVGVVGGYRERDKFIRLCSYTARFLAGSGQTKWGIRLTTIATELSACRTVLRLFDDVPMLAHTLRYGSGSKVSKQHAVMYQVVFNFTRGLFILMTDFLQVYISSPTLYGVIVYAFAYRKINLKLKSKVEKIEFAHLSL